MNRTRLSLAPRAGAFLALSLLAACGGSAAPSAAPASSAATGQAVAASGKPAAAPSAAAAGAASAKPAGSAAASGASGAASTAPIKVGFILPLTGVAAPVGQDNIDAFNLYLQSVNNTVAGRQIQVITADEGQPDAALTKAKQLTENEHVNVLMGINSTASCYAIAPYVKQVQEPLIVSLNCGAESLMTDPKYASPYLVRFTQNGTIINDPAADWAYSAGKRKAVLVTSDYGGGIENGDLFASAFIKRGGSIIQEIYPPLGNSDFGPYLSKLDPSADLIMAFFQGVDALRFGEQYATYSGSNHPTVLELFGSVTSGPNLDQLKDKAVGFVASATYTTDSDTPENKAFMQAFSAKYPGRAISANIGQGWSMAQVLAAAIQKVNGNVEDKQAFMNALYSLTANTAKGPVKLDPQHDVVQNTYIYETVKNGSSYAQKLQKTYEAVSRTWDRTQAEIDALQIGTHKGKWVGVTAAQVDQMEKK
ncbi:MAG TPA: ABC transporter substrate-binding protein [Chloroflexota bacterium]|nr:ABC transporter substrate-binding protein [Chloroflexota bacterium]